MADWADQAEDDYSARPPEHTGGGFPQNWSGPVDPKTGIKEVVEYFKTAAGKAFKVTRHVKVVKTSMRVNQKVKARLAWPKFGLCKGKTGREEGITSFDGEVQIDLRPLSKRKEMADFIPSKAVNTAIICQNCKQPGHFRRNCPKAPAGGADLSAMDTAPEDSGIAKYSPPARGEGFGGGFQRSEENTVRVTNISEEADEDDLRALFRTCGRTTRVYLAKEKERDGTFRSRGFAFISFSARDEAEKAVRDLNNYPYANLILHVEHSKPREDPAGGGGAASPVAAAAAASSSGRTPLPLRSSGAAFGSGASASGAYRPGALGGARPRMQGPGSSGPGAQSPAFALGPETGLSQAAAPVVRGVWASNVRQ